MKIKWLGHASFLITSDTGTRLITDPYTPKDNLTYGDIKESADIVTVSHEHLDHNNAVAVKGNPKVIKGAVSAEVKGVKIKGLAAAHDDAGGKMRGKNTIFCFDIDGVRLGHLGDLGHRITNDQVTALGKVDILFLPVGGFYTIDAKVATEVANQLKPGVIIPMHFRNEKCSYPITGVDEFLKGKKDVRRLDASEVEFKAGQLPSPTQIVVLKPAL
jgi:L-ascorbate metabolism protein UlaG (beta-lactamase superfamily)